MQRIKPKPLSVGAFFSVVAPSSQVNGEWLDKGEAKLSQLGLKLTYTKQIFASHRFWAGSDSERAEDFLKECERSDTQALWCARGGYGATRILALFDEMNLPARLRSNPKLLLGYSDITALHFYFWEKARIPSLHAPLMATPSWLKMKRPAVQEMAKLWSGQAGLEKKSYTRAWPTRFLGRGAAAEGILLGGNLSVLCALIGTPWQPNLDGSLLFLEDCNEAPYRLDRMLNHLASTGMFDGVRAVLAGDLEHDVPKELLKKVHWREVLRDRFAPMGIPILTDLPIGHGARNEALPIGVQARITKSGKLELLEQVVEN